MAEVSATTDIVKKLHDCPHRGVIYVTGGGSLVLSDLLQVPGASATLLEARIPYAEASLASLLGAPPEQACSPETARDLAMCAYLRAQQLAPNPTDPTDPTTPTGPTTPTDPTTPPTPTTTHNPDTFGFAITASLGSTRPKRGRHRAYCALQTSARTHTTALRLAKGRRTRAGEERLLADVALAAMAEALGVARPRVELTTGEAVETEVAEGGADLPALLSGARSAVGPGGPGGRAPKAILPGAFNPLHEGHRRMAAAAAERLGEAVAYELCIRNVDKPPLNFHDMRTRRAQFGGSEDVWLTNASTFVEKARVFGGVTFVVGADTMRRIADAKYYADGDVGGAVDELAATGCRFLVFGRALGGALGGDQGDGGDQADRFVTLDDLALPDRLRAMSEGFSEAEFRSDVSSTELRARRASGA